MSLTNGQPPTEADVVIIGSGFGGSVMADQLAETGRSVCVLERGQAFPPGSFPRTPTGLAANFWSPSDGLYGMFNAWSFDGLDALVSSGLGGGSLIYANVLLRKDRSWFTQRHPYQPGVTETWGVGYDDLDEHYGAVEEFMQVQELPLDDQDPHSEFHLRKTIAMREVARGRGEFQLAPLAVRFRDDDGNPAIGADLSPPDYGNIHGRPRRTCRMLAECDVGCNEGAKNSLDHTYLSRASHLGASIHTGTEVRTITRLPDGTFEVGLVVHDFDQEGPQLSRREMPVQTIRTPHVVVSAGAIGSTYLLLANRDRLGLTSPHLGTRFSGNGDLLGFIFDSAEPLEGTHGPVITSYIRYPDEQDTTLLKDYGMYLEDAGYPVIAAWLAELTEAGGQVRRLAELAAKRSYSRITGRGRTNLSADISHLLGPGAFTRNALPLLGMGRDIPDGTIYLRDAERGKDPVLDSTWTTRTSQHYFDTMIDNMGSLAEGLQGEFQVNPTFLMHRVITVHPVGGCPMPTSASPGVVDEFGTVHGVPGLHVADAAVMPGPVGANPSLTIAAFARRAALHLAEQLGEVA